MDNIAGAKAAFCIGNIVEAGLEYDRKPGDWYGPSTMIQIFEQLNDTYRPYSKDLEIIAFPEGVIYRDRIEKKAVKGGIWVPIILLVGFRLGLEKINTEYYAPLLRLMRIPAFVGISGGQGSGALYFVGYQKSQLIFLDPHVTQV